MATYLAKVNRVMYLIPRCRTGRLGGMPMQCEQCGSLTMNRGLAKVVTVRLAMQFRRESGDRRQEVFGFWFLVFGFAEIESGH